jgi:hypothetical protein
MNRAAIIVTRVLSHPAFSSADCLGNHDANLAMIKINMLDV